MPQPFTSGSPAKLWTALVLGALCVGASAAAARPPTGAVDDDRALAELDHSIFAKVTASAALKGSLLDPNLSWTNTLGVTYNRSEILKVLQVGRGVPEEIPGDLQSGMARSRGSVTQSNVIGSLGVVQLKWGNLYILRVWIKMPAGWRLLVYQAVATGAPPPAGSEKGECENPCRTVPFHPKNQDEADVIHAYQAVERAVTAHNSAAWGAHISDEFFAVTSNSDRPLYKATRMAGLDNQKTGGIPPFPLASARMYEFGDAMVMISTQQPQHGNPLHVTRVWFKRDGTWLEAYSYQTTIRNLRSVR